MSEKSGIYITNYVADELAKRGSEHHRNRSNIINRDLERLYILYRRALKEIPLKTEEACLIIDALNGILLTADTAGLLYANIENACAIDHLDQKWQVDGAALVKKLRGLTGIQALALIDAAERFWVAEAEHKDIREAVKEYFHLARG